MTQRVFIKLVHYLYMVRSEGLDWDCLKEFEYSNGCLFESLSIMEMFQQFS